jgi:hypothetical protein
MAKTILGYEVASPERQRKTALALIGVVVVLLVAGAIALFSMSRGQHAGREQAMATVTGFEAKCRYVVRNISRRASYYDHTGYIDCDTAQQVARDNDSVLGSVQRATLAAVEFTARDGSTIRSHVELSRKEPVSVGERVEILYRTDDPTDLREYFRLPLGFVKSSIAPQPESKSPLAEKDAARPRPSDAYSGTTLMWVGIATLIVGALLAYFLIKGLYRAVVWLVRAPGGAAQPPGPVTAAAIGRGRLEAATRRTSDAAFGRRSS